MGKIDKGEGVTWGFSLAQALVVRIGYRLIKYAKIFYDNFGIFAGIICQQEQLRQIYGDDGIRTRGLRRDRAMC